MEFKQNADCLNYQLSCRSCKNYFYINFLSSSIEGSDFNCVFPAAELYCGKL